MSEALPSLLLAEDDPLVGEVLSQALAALPARVDQVSSAAAALAAARRQRYALLVLDLGLPDQDGGAVLASLRADPAAASRHAPALALSAAAGSLPPGFQARLQKPLSALRLREAARGLLGGTGASRIAAVAEPEAAGDPLPTWDDEAALAALNGRMASVQAMRELLRGELPGRREAVREALARGDAAAAGGELHRMRAAAGFCGAVALAAAAARLEDALPGPPSPATIAEFEAACAAVLGPG